MSILTDFGMVRELCLDKSICQDIDLSTLRYNYPYLLDSIIAKTESQESQYSTDLEEEVREYIILLIRYRNEMIRLIERGDKCGPVELIYKTWFGNDLDRMIEAKLL